MAIKILQSFKYFDEVFWWTLWWTADEVQDVQKAAENDLIIMEKKKW